VSGDGEVSREPEDRKAFCAASVPLALGSQDPRMAGVAAQGASAAAAFALASATRRKDR
jgi:hypothetical protein